MAAASASKSCLRALRLTRVSSTHGIPCATSSSTSHGYLHTATPLYLDFLAPSWRKSMDASRSSKSNSSLPPPPRRNFSASPLRPAAKAVTNPRKDEDGNEMNIIITPRAAHRLQTIAETDNNPDLALRVSVESGGCHGFQYLMSLTSVADIDAAEDTVFENEAVARPGSSNYRAKVVMDEPSLEMLKGSSVDYTMELIGSQFKITGIPGATSSCGCGTSFDIAA